MGDSVDFQRASGVIPRRWLMVFGALIDAPTAGQVIEVYLAPSADNAIFPGGVSGADEAYSTDESEWKKQLGPPVCILVVTADAGLQYAFAEVTISARYGAPVVINMMATDFEDTTDPNDHTSTIAMYPLSDHPLD